MLGNVYVSTQIQIVRKYFPIDEQAIQSHIIIIQSIDPRGNIVTEHSPDNNTNSTNRIWSSTKTVN